MRSKFIGFNNDKSFQLCTIVHDFMSWRYLKRLVWLLTWDKKKNVLQGTGLTQDNEVSFFCQVNEDEFVHLSWIPIINTLINFKNHSMIFYDSA